MLLPAMSFYPLPVSFSPTLRPQVRLFNGKAFRLLLSDLTCISVVITGDFILLSFTIHPTSSGGQTSKRLLGEKQADIQKDHPLRTVSSFYSP